MPKPPDPGKRGARDPRETDPRVQETLPSTRNRPPLVWACIQSQIYDRGWVSLACFGKPWRARSLLYRSHILQANTRWKALAEIYTMHSFAPFSKLKIFVKIAPKNAIAKLNFRLFFNFFVKFCIFSANVYDFFYGFRDKFQKRVTAVVFQSNLRKQIRILPKFLKYVKIIQ